MVPIPTEPLDVTRSLSVPSVVTLKCPSEPVSTTSASVFPSEILSPAADPPEFAVLYETLIDPASK